VENENAIAALASISVTCNELATIDRETKSLDS
jgi:hypothetical protein